MDEKRFFTFCRFTGCNKNRLVISILVFVSNREGENPDFDVGYVKLMVTISVRISQKRQVTGPPARASRYLIPDT
jgi:hypothetical protein